MSQTILRDSYLEQIKTLYDAGGFLGENFISKLEDVTEEEAFAIPVNGLRTIAEFLFHIIAWRRSVIYRLEGSEYPIEANSEKDWANPEGLKKQGWESLKKEFDESQARVITALKRIDDDFLNTIYGERGNRFTYLVEGMIHHDVYHLGQIGTVKKLLRMDSARVK